MNVRGPLRRFCLALALACLGLPAAWAGANDAAGVEATLRGQPDLAVAALDSLLPSSQGLAQVEVLVLKGFLLVQMGEMTEAERVAQALDRLGAGADAGPSPSRRVDLTAAAAAGLLRARALARTGPASRADRVVADARAQLPDHASPSLRMRFLDTQAGIKQSLGKLDLAVALYQEAVGLSDGKGPLWLRSDLRGSLAYALVLARQPERAQAINHEGVELAKQSGDLLAQSAAMTVESIVQSALGNRIEELRASEAALSLARQAGAKRQQVLTTANLADFYLKREDYPTALRLAQEALPLAREVKDKSSESVALTNSGLAMIGLGRHAEGQALVRQALVIEEAAGALTEMLAIQEELGHALEKAGLLRAAWQALSEHRRMADDVFQRQHQQAVLELQEGFDAERRQRELAALQTDNQLKQAQLDQRDLQQKLWAAGVVAGLLLLVLVAVLLRRMRRSNEQLQSSNALLKVAGERDPLTGLANRRHLLAVMQQSADEGGGFDGSMMLIDVDHFKRINDQHGHAAGDKVLVEIARRLQSALREQDLTVRWGGEEFLVVVRALPNDEVETLAQRLLTVIGGQAVELGRERIMVTASIGFATFPLLPQRRALAWERAIDLVDTAMYLAKAHGRNRAYGVRALQHEEGALETAQASQLEVAWRDGRAELAHLSGPVPSEP
jgi:diguanylate cyclase (GGDEF)-like protein